MPNLISPKHIDRIDSALSRIDDILGEYSARLEDRKTPVTPGIARFARQMAEEAKAIMSRDGVKPVMPDLAPHDPLTPGDLFVALLMIRNGLSEFAIRNAPDAYAERLRS